MNEFVAALKARPLLLDGALGTELERCGVDTAGTGWTALANLSHPELVERLHAEHIAAGADIITANSFRTNIRAQGGEEARARSLTERAIELASNARRASGRRDVFIAGSIAPVEDCFTPERVPRRDAEIFREHSLMAQWGEQSGADLILIETMSSFREAFIALAAARRSTTLPVLVSLVPQSLRTLTGIPIRLAAQHLAVLEPTAILLNCASISEIGPAMHELAAALEGSEVHWGIYPNRSERRGDGAWDLSASTDEQFSDIAGEALALGARVVGSCCGSQASTTRAIAARLGLKKGTS